MLEDSCPGPLREVRVPGSLSSAELIARARAGDGVAWDELVQRHQERLLRIVRIRLGSGGLRRFLESADVVQETWRAALGGLGGARARDEDELARWLAAIATNEIRDQVDALRAARRARDREEPLGEDSLHQPADAGVGPATRAEAAEVRDLLDQAVAELAPDDREVVLLRDYCGADWTAIAARLGRPSVHAAQQLHQRAWIRVRRRLAGRLGGTA